MTSWTWLNNKFATLKKEYEWYWVKCQLCSEQHDNADDFACSDNEGIALHS